jgi:hypothetical protein
MFLVVSAEGYGRVVHRVAATYVTRERRLSRSDRVGLTRGAGTAGWYTLIRFLQNERELGVDGWQHCANNFYFKVVEE